MRDQDEFSGDPRGEQEVAEQQPETQRGGRSGERVRPGDRDEERGGQTGRDDAGEASGNPPNAG